MHWEKIGRIFNPSDYTRHEKLYTHASNPTVVKLQGDLIRVFYSGRDKKNKSSVGAFDFNMKTLNIEKVFFNPFAQPTKNTFFLKDGISVGTVIKIKSEEYLYFMGWQNPKLEHWRGDIGRFKLNKNGSLNLDPNHPIVSKNDIDNISVSYPWIIKSRDGLFKMWYGSTITWDAGNNEMLHVINYATSQDGLRWSFKGQAIPSKVGFAQAFSRPTVYESCDLNYHMWFSYRSGTGTSYRIGYAKKDHSNNKWELLLNESIISLSTKGWDSEMLAYPCVYKFDDKLYMFYNGNQYGMTGIGLAVSKI